MTLYQKLNAILTSLNAGKEDVRAALSEKGVVIEGEFTERQIASFIRLIYQGEWEFFFNFKDIDQFGSPRTLQSGQPTGGFNLFHPVLNINTELTTFDFSHLLVLSGIPTTGQWGVWEGSNTPISAAMPDITIISLEGFNETVIAEEMHQYEDTLS